MCGGFVAFIVRKVFGGVDSMCGRFRRTLYLENAADSGVIVPAGSYKNSPDCYLCKSEMRTSILGAILVIYEALVIVTLGAS